MRMGYFIMSVIEDLSLQPATFENISTLEVSDIKYIHNVAFSVKMIFRPYQPRKGNTNGLHVKYVV